MISKMSMLCSAKGNEKEAFQKKNSGWQDSSVGKGTRCQGCQPEFHSQNLHDREN